MTDPANKGFVTLVGAGPGDPGLLTLAGRDALARAEVVLYDRLVSKAILSVIPCSAEKIGVGKTKGHHPVPQEEINRLLLEKAREGKRVVRLKGGDPYLFGRGAEELELLRQNGIPFRIVPGVTSALAAPTYAGIPVTHRDHASSLHILTGHGKDGTPPKIPYDELAKLDGTLVFLMGLSSLNDIVTGLLKAGLPPSTPAAVIENGTCPNQRKIVASLSGLPEEVRAQAVVSPAVIVVGRVCALSEEFDWTRFLPLWGKEILCVSAQTTAGRLAGLLRQYGAEATEFAGIVREPLSCGPEFWRTVPEYQWVVLTSHFGAELFLKGLYDYAVDLRRLAGVKIACVGTGTAKALSAAGLYADHVPGQFNARSLGEDLAGMVHNEDSVLIFRARDGDPELAAALQATGARVDDVAAYNTVPCPMERESIDKLREGGFSAVTFTSASGVKAFVEAGASAKSTRVFCIGEATAAAARAHGMSTEVSPKANLETMAAFVAESFPHLSAKE